MRQRFLTKILLAVSVSCTAVLAQAGKTDDVTGKWKGKSTCTVRPSACHDENVIYEITSSAPGKLRWRADKIINGERENMGVLECTYENQALKCPFERGVWTLNVNGARMTGTLRLTDGTVFRTVDARRD